MVNFKTLALIPALLAAAAPTTDPTPSTTYVGEVVWPLRGQPLRLNMTYPLVWDITSEDIETGTPGRICLSA